MSEQVKINIFLELAKSFPVIDVRSPKEFSEGNTKGSINFPLFTDEERAKVGTRYKLSGSHDAVLLALDLIGPRLTEYIRKAYLLAKDNTLLLYCWRGGMRSSSMAWLLTLAGFRVYVLEGGYKAYRKYIRDSFERKASIIILAGMTGSGKTELLDRLAEAGEQVLNLETAARHKGSVLGSLGFDAQPSNEQFENDLFAQWNKFDLSKPVWIEDESFQIGRVNIPKPLFQQMSCAAAINIKVDRSIRIERLVSEYAHFNIDSLKECILRLEKRIGGNNTKLVLQYFDSNDFPSAASLLLDYYDKAYSFNISRRSLVRDYEINNNIQNADISGFINFARKTIKELNIH